LLIETTIEHRVALSIREDKVADGIGAAEEDADD
jgi:hypothetical protein